MAAFSLLDTVSGGRSRRKSTRIHGTPRRNQPAPGYLRVSLVKAKNGFVQVVLPQPATPFGETIFVKKTSVDFNGP